MCRDLPNSFAAAQFEIAVNTLIILFFLRRRSLLAPVRPYLLKFIGRRQPLDRLINLDLPQLLSIVVQTLLSDALC